MVQIYAGSPTPQRVRLDDLMLLEKAGIANGYLPMRDLNDEHIEHLVASGLEAIPPLQVVHTDKGYGVVDGYHRWVAALTLGLDQIDVIVGTYHSEQEVIEAAFRANLQHGLPLDTFNRAAYAVWLHETYPHLTQDDIAKRVGLTQASVSRAIKRHYQRLDQTRVEGDSEQTGYNEQQIDYTRKLLMALSAFYDNERALLGGKDSRWSENARAKALVSAIGNPTMEIVEVYQSLSRSLDQAATLLRAKVKPATKK